MRHLLWLLLVRHLLWLLPVRYLLRLLGRILPLWQIRGLRACAGSSQSCPERACPLFAAPRRKHQVYTVTNRQCCWDRAQRHALQSHKPAGGLDSGGEGRLKGWINAGFLAPSEPR